jgi:hypothetical protein
VRWALVALLLAAPVAAAEPPNLIADADATRIRIAPELFDEPAVARRLRSGLTTTLRIELVARTGPKRRGGARVGIRWDLWDERWIVQVFEFDGKRERTILPPGTGLASWIGARTWRVAPPANDPSPWTVELEVLPFSSSEEEDARDWASRGTAMAPKGDLDESSDFRFLDLILGTSIRARPLLRYRWVITPETRP